MSFKNELKYDTICSGATCKQYNEEMAQKATELPREDLAWADEFVVMGIDRHFESGLRNLMTSYEFLGADNVDNTVTINSLNIVDKEDATTVHDNFQNLAGVEVDQRPHDQAA